MKILQAHRRSAKGVILRVPGNTTEIDVRISTSDQVPRIIRQRQRVGLALLGGDCLTRGSLGPEPVKQPSPVGFDLRAVEERFMDPRHLMMWQVVATPEEVPAALANAPAWSAQARSFAAV